MLHMRTAPQNRPLFSRAVGRRSLPTAKGGLSPRTETGSERPSYTMVQPAGRAIVCDASGESVRTAAGPWARADRAFPPTGALSVVKTCRCGGGNSLTTLCRTGTYAKIAAKIQPCVGVVFSVVRRMKDDRPWQTSNSGRKTPSIRLDIRPASGLPRTSPAAASKCGFSSCSLACSWCSR